MGRNLEGLTVVVCTPFDGDDRIDEQKLRKHVESLIQGGKVNGIMPCGASSEANLLTQKEWETVVAIVAETVGSRVHLIVGCSDITTRNTINRLKFAEKVGADGAMVSPPWYVGPSEREVYEHFKALSEASGLPVVLYNTPHSTGVDVKPEQIAKIAELGQLKYKKTSSGDMTRMAAVERLCGDKVKFLVGCDSLALEQFLMGAVGWITPCGNFMAERLQNLYDLAVNKKDLAGAKALYFKMLPMFSLFESGQYIQLTKYAIRTLSTEYGNPRRPLLPVTSEAQAQMDAMLKNMDLL